MSARRVTTLVAASLLLGCPPPVPMPMEEDAGEPVVPVYDGPTQGSGIPDRPPGFGIDASIPLIDAGVIPVDMTCCQTQFGISDEEPAGGVDGVLRIELPRFAGGVPLVRSGGRWTASACFPINYEAPYFYEFTYDAGLADGGLFGLDDGGVIGLEFVDIRVTRRASADEPAFLSIDGAPSNRFRAVSSCAGLDGSVPR